MTVNKGTTSNVYISPELLRTNTSPFSIEISHLMTPSPFRSIGIGLAIDLTCGFELNHGKSCNNDCPSNPLRTYKYDVAVGMMITFYCPCQSRVMSGEASMLLVTRVVHYKCIGT